MYIRFDTLLRDTHSRVGTGIFQATSDCWFDTPTQDWPWQYHELRRQLDWFNSTLDVPNRMHYRPGRRGGRSGICWFRNQAHEHISRARYMAWLLQDIGIHTRSLRSADPGTILWQDNHQVVALPVRELDTCRHSH